MRKETDKREKENTMQFLSKEIPTRHEGNAEFLMLKPTDIEPGPAVVQALDNQWLPNSLLRKAIKQGQLNRSVRTILTQLVRTEYLHTFLNQRQLVINRAYLYNTHSISQDYMGSKRKREVFRKLLAEGSILTFLFTENSPLEPPRFQINASAFAAWQQLCQEVRIHCLRLSWDETLNRRIAQAYLARRFHDFAQNMASGDSEQYLLDLSVAPNSQESLQKQLLFLSHRCLTSLEQGKLISRSDLYQAFISAGEGIVDQRYDSTKPFSAEIKQLLDLAYNSYLADALGGHLLTPAASPPRTALQEWRQTTDLPRITSENLLEVIQKASFPRMPEGFYLRSPGLLELQDIYTARQTEEWEQYMRSLEMLQEHPLQFGGEITARLCQNYLTLLGSMTESIQKRYPGRIASFISVQRLVVELVVDIAGALLIITWAPHGPEYRFSGQISSLLGSVTAPVVARLVIKNLHEEEPQTNRAIRIDFLRYRMQDAQRQWDDLRQRVSSLPGFRPGSPEPPGEHGPGINYREPI